MDAEARVRLSMEETGWLCHAMMEQTTFKALVMRGAKTKLEKRMFNLYRKLASANDVLMGKQLETKLNIPRAGDVAFSQGYSYEANPHPHDTPDGMFWFSDWFRANGEAFLSHITSGEET